MRLLRILVFVRMWLGMLKTMVKSELKAGLNFSVLDIRSLRPTQGGFTKQGEGYYRFYNDSF